MAKSVKDWNKDDVKKWLGGLPQFRDTKKKMEALVDKENLNGYALFQLRMEDFIGDFGLTGLKAAGVMGQVQQLKDNAGRKAEEEERKNKAEEEERKNKAEEEERKKRADLNMSVALWTLKGSRAPSSRGFFKIHIFYDNKMILLRTDVNRNTMIRDIKEYYRNQEVVKERDFDFITRGATVNENSTLAANGIIDEMGMLTVKFKVEGGSSTARVMNFDHPLVIRSNDVCCIMQDDKDPTAEMPCGHAISAEGLFQWVESCASNPGVKGVYCPVLDCPSRKADKPWNWDVIVRVAALTQAENLKYAPVFERRNAPNTRECPHCLTLCGRPDNLTRFRVRCVRCRKGDWCFACSKPWTGRGMTICGNTFCPTYNTQENLNNCPLITPEYVSNVFVPKYRACPKCLMLIEYLQKCKHMKCPKCQLQFCLVCLGLYDEKKKWPCGSYKDLCPVAPRQQL